MTTQHDERAELVRHVNQVADALCDERLRKAAALLAADAQAGGEAVAFIKTTDIGKPVCSVYAPKEFHSWPNKRLVTDGVYIPIYTHTQPKTAPGAVQDGWQPIETAPKVGRKMFVVCAFNVCNGFTGGKPYTTDPWCVWRDDDGCFARWPHNFEPTHWMPLPPAPKPQETV